MKGVKKYTPEEAMQYAAGLCATSEQCEFDMLRKLALHGVCGADAERIINYLYDHSFLDERRFASAFARDKARFSRWGRIKIRMALAARKVSSDSISEGIDSIDEKDYLGGLQKMVGQYASKENLHERDSRLKLLRRLSARGFELSLINRAIDKELSGEE